MNMLSRLAATMPPILARSLGRRQLVSALLASVVLSGTGDDAAATRRQARSHGSAGKRTSKRCKGRKCRRCPKGTVYLGGKGRRSVGWCASVALETSLAANAQLSAVAVAPDGSFYVADDWLHLIEHYAADGTLLKRAGGVGSQPGKFVGPVALTLDDEANVYVVDPGNNRVQRLSSTLTSPTVWASNIWSGTGIVYQGPDDIYVSFQGPLGVGIIFKFRKNGTNVGSSSESIGQPLALASGTGQYGVIYPDRQFQAIRQMSDDLKTIGLVPTPEVSEPQGIVNTPRGALVADTQNNRLVLYRPEGTPLMFGAAGTAVGKFDTPRGMALGPDGAVYIADSGNHRIIKLTPAK